MVYAVRDSEDFNTQLASAGQLLVVVDFHATWCGPCKFIAPKLEEFANTYASKIVVLKVDVDECEDLAVTYNVASMPTFVFIKDSKQIESFSGANPDKLEEIIKNITDPNRIDSAAISRTELTASRETVKSGGGGGNNNHKKSVTLSADDHHQHSNDTGSNQEKTL